MSTFENKAEQDNFNAGVTKTATDAAKAEVSKLEIPSVDGLASKEELSKEIETVKNENIDLQKSVDNLESTVKTFTILTNKTQGETLKGELSKKENQEGLKALKGGEVHSFSIKLSPENEVSKALTYGPGAGATAVAGATSVPQEQRDNEIMTNPHYQTSVAANIMNATTSNKDIVRYIREDSVDASGTAANTFGGTNSAAGKAQGAAFATKNFNLRNYQETIVTIGEFARFHEEQLTDVAGLRSFVTGEFMGDLRDLVDRYILGGTGSANNQLNGFSATGQSTAWVDQRAASAVAIGGANNIDVLINAIAQLESANYQADTIFMNPTEFWGAAFLLAKSTQAEYVGRQILQAAQTGVMPMVGGAKIVRSNAVAGDAFYVLDSKKSAKLWTGEGAEIEFARSGDDFQNNQVSGRIKCRKALTVGRPTGIIVGDFSTARTELAAAQS